MRDLINSLFEPSARSLIRKVRAAEKRMRSLTDGGLRVRTDAFRERLERGESLASLVPEAFACVIVAAERTVGMRHFDVQIQGGVELARGRIVEMKTGEGKTLVATLPAYLHALAGKGVHIVTVNDYLASRDAEWMAPIYELLGLTVGCVQEQMGADRLEEIRQRRAANACDITYVTNAELVFDFLRDNLAFHPSEIVQRGVHFAIVDEVDLLLIDEAQTPLIISGPGQGDETSIRQADAAVRGLDEGRDYKADHRSRAVALTDKGLAAIEAVLDIGSLTDPQNLAWAHAVYQALQAHGIYERDVEYIIENAEIHIVDEHTGRVSADKRYSNGLHQALEAKEGVPIQDEDLTLAKTSYQYYFRAYPVLSGMTGTAWSEREELRKTYFRKVVRIPTHKEMIREDYERVALLTTPEKHVAVVAEIEETRDLGRPVLVGTVSVEESERLSAMLDSRGIPHAVLNARQHDDEAAVIAQAGRVGAVTISTNMAGRGTDIVLGGNPRFLAAEQGGTSEDEREAALERFREQCNEEHERVVAAGGLHVIGTAEHESVRLDNQLRGRAGRQGDPGTSSFYVCLEDPVYRRFGQKKVLPRLWDLLDDHPTGEEISETAVLAALNELRRKVEVENEAVRLDVLKYDAVIHDRREAIWGWRRSLLKTQHADEWKSSCRDVIEDLLQRLDEDFERVSESASEKVESPSSREKWRELLGLVYGWLPMPELERDPADASQAVDALHERYLARFGGETDTLLIEWERMSLLGIIDSLWPQYLNDLERVEEGIWMRSFAQQDPFVEFRREAAQMYGALMKDIELNALRGWLSVQSSGSLGVEITLSGGPETSPATSPLETRRTRRR